MVVNITVHEDLIGITVALLAIWVIADIVLKIVELRYERFMDKWNELDKKKRDKFDQKSKDPLDDPNSWQSQHKAAQDEFIRTGRSPGGGTSYPAKTESEIKNMPDKYKPFKEVLDEK